MATTQPALGAGIRARGADPVAPAKGKQTEDTWPAAGEPGADGDGPAALGDIFAGLRAARPGGLACLRTRADSDAASEIG